MAYTDMAAAITRPTANNYHALLFVGVCNRQRYVLSLIRWTNLLHTMYGYPLENIRIIVGTYSDPAWAPMVAGTDVTYDATRATLDDALVAYAAGSGDPHELGPDDSLFIFTFNHGGQDGTGSYLCADDFTTKFYATDFAARINNIHCRQIIYYAAQCRSGGFLNPFINVFETSGRNGVIITGSRADQDTWEAVSDKLFASAFNGRMVQNPLDDNIDIGITGNGIGVYTVPGYSTDRIDWGSTGVLSTREAFNWVYDHFVTNIYPDPAYSSIIEIPLYSQHPWLDAGKEVSFYLGVPDLIMQDCTADTGVEPSTCGSPWYSPDVYPDNTDQFPGTTTTQYVPAHHNRFFVRTANRGTAPTDDFFRILEVRGLGFLGGPVGPPRIDRAMETSGGVTVSARLRPGRAHSEYHRILIGADFGHGCVSGASFSDCDPLDHDLWFIVQDNDQAQCNMDPAAVSGTFPVDSTSVNSNAGKIVRVIPIANALGGKFTVKVGRIQKDLPFKVVIPKETVQLKKMEKIKLTVEVHVENKTKDGIKGEIPIHILQNDKIVGGFTLLIRTATSYAKIFVHDKRNLAAPKIKVNLTHPGDPRILSAVTDKRGFASFGPMNPGFYFITANNEKCEPVRVNIQPGDRNSFKFGLGDC